MQIVSFIANGKTHYGRLEGERLVAASDGLRARYPDVRALLAGDATAALGTDEGGAEFAAADVTFLPPVPNPGKIICVGINYRPHVEEMGRDLPERPMLFVRFPGSLTGHGQPVLRPAVSEKFDYEGELAVVIGRPARHVARDGALGVVAGYSCFMDGSVRDWQNHTSQFTPGKNFETSGAMGPALVTADAVSDPTELRLETRLNGEVMQEGKLSDLIFDVPALIEYCATFTTLEPGDVIATGTPGGVGAARKPPVWLRDGDEIAVVIDGVGRLRNPVRDA
ncbi:MAG: fumarylacetoacetate hydrolase family protein [Woeseiaceae bacterium]|nr:fumarylacetoacetate hydrolase family protein [Woeseiaceae bacterium]